MFYKLSILTLNNFFIKRVFRKIRKMFGKKDRADTERLIKKYANGKSFADIGALWGIDGANSFFAEENGATRIVAVDVYPESENFLKEKRRRNSAVEFVKGDINLPNTIKNVGMCDTVFCSGILYHTPNPFHLLINLRSICGETLILNTTCIPEMHGVRNIAVFYPFLNKKQRKIWDRGIGAQKAITGPYEPMEGYANWFWGMSPSCIESMLQCAGFQITERHIFKFDCAFVCKPVSVKFIAESGEWTTPKDKDYLKFRHSSK